MPVRDHGLLAALAALVLSSCVQFSWRRSRRFEPLPKDALAGLEAGRTTLTECLERLGAPLYVWEYKGDGAALAWGWVERDQKGLSVSVPLQDYASASVSYDEADDDLRGAVLLFDEQLLLERVREGRLRDLERQLGRRRAAAVTEESVPAPPPSQE